MIYFDDVVLFGLDIDRCARAPYAFTGSGDSNAKRNRSGSTSARQVLNEILLKMKSLFILLITIFLASPPCTGKSVMEKEQSVVSVYTTIPTTAGTTASLDVYQQIANNIAERITSPIYKFLGISNKTEEKTTKRPWDKIEILDEPEDASKTELKPVDNDISNRDVEELSPDVTQKANKPEKITLFSSYLPVKAALNETNDIDDDFSEFDLEDDGEKPREGPFVYILELVGSIIQLLWGGFLTLFRPSSSSNN